MAAWMTKVLLILHVLCILIAVESSHGQRVNGKEKGKTDFWKSGVNFKLGSRMRSSSGGWRKKPSRMSEGSQGRIRRLNPKFIPRSGRPKKMIRSGRHMVSLSTIENLIKALGLRVDQIGGLVEKIAIKLGIPIPSNLPAPSTPSPPSTPTVQLLGS